MSSSASRPLRVRVTHKDGAAIAAVTISATAVGSGASPSGAVTSNCHSTADTASCNAGARSANAATPVTTIPSGSAAVERVREAFQIDRLTELDVEELGV